MTQQKKERIDLYTIDRIPTGETAFRGEALPEGRYRMVVHVCVFNTKGDMLIQKRKVRRRYEPRRRAEGTARGTGAFRRFYGHPSGIDRQFSRRIRRFLRARDGRRPRSAAAAGGRSRDGPLGDAGGDRGHDRRRQLYPVSERSARLSVFHPQRQKHVESVRRNDE